MVTARGALGAVAAMMLVAACAMGGRKVSPSAAPQTTDTTQSTGAANAPSTDASPLPDPREEIARLFQEVEARRGDMRLEEPTALAEPATPMSATPLSSDPTCRPAKTDRCSQSCTFSDSICGNARRICDLAAQLPGDAWAADKCVRAKQTCATAHETCCTCQ